jgi:hypothetical protein
MKRNVKESESKLTGRKREAFKCSFKKLTRREGDLLTSERSNSKKTLAKIS